MRDPFKIEGPALVSFSGGRSSAYMLWRVLKAHGGVLPDDVKVTFANTGKEMPQTLDFVLACERRWNADVVWLEYGRGEVGYYTASRNGEPYAALIERKKYLPNPVTRFCTEELKIKPMEKFARSLGWDEWTTVVGFRADEPLRRAREDRITPLRTAGVSKRDVMAFWQTQDFDLGLPSVNGTTPLGNCELCFLKGVGTIMGIMRDLPGVADWWIEQEAKIGATFRSDRPSYAAMADAVRDQAVFDFDDADRRADCFCTEDQ